MMNFGTFSGWGLGAPPSAHPTYGPSIGDSAVEHKVGMRGYDGGIHNSPFAEGRIKEPFWAPGAYNPFMFQKPRRRRINLLSVVQVLALPFIIFAMTTYMFGFSVFNNAPHWSYFWLAFCIVLSFVFLGKAFFVFKRQRNERWTVPWYLMNDDDTWFLWLGMSVFFGSIIGVLVGGFIFDAYMKPYYSLSLLHTYDNVDPVSEGKAYLDTGAVIFKKDSYVDIKHAVGYKDGSVYCVAPIKLGTDPVMNFDFWAVGKDCCTGFPGSFNCFDQRQDTLARGGLRVVDNADIAFYKLAQMQANGEFKENAELLKDGRLNTVTPIFLSWMRDPIGKINGMWDNAVWTYGVALGVFAVCEGAFVSIQAYLYWKNKLWG